MHLAIDTSGTAQALVLLDGRRVLAAADWERARQDPPVLARLQGLFKDGGVRPDALEGVAVARGPGSFTGLRVGLALAAGMAYARHLPLFLLDSLPLLARRRLSERATVAIRDAGHGEVYAWREGDGIARLSVAALPGWLRSSAPIMVEPAGRLAVWSPVHAALEVPLAQRAPASRALADSSIEAFEIQKPVRYDEVQALYVQPAAAEERERKAPS